ncbi:unnamed protein product [Rhizophagus irregularis]|nr:unnamed protein product [Rhizophagus irregularis]
MELDHSSIIKNSFELTPRLKSSPTQILFTPFDIDNISCDCGRTYSETLLLQKFCKYCLFVYIKNTTNFDEYLDIHYRKYLSIEEQFEKWPESLYFKQIVSNQSFFYDKSYETCELCGHKHYGIICSECYPISFAWLESTSTIPILYLPWWDTHKQCIICDSKLKFNSNSQKLCTNCLTVYIGCRYCLTTNIVFGITEQSQCIKCKRISLINVNMSASMTYIGEYFSKFNTHSFNQIANYVSNIGKNSNILEIYSLIKKLNYFHLKIYSQIANLEKNENSLNVTIPIMFIPFNNNERHCYCCKKKYSKTILFKQKYCKNCLSWYIKYATSSVDIRYPICNLDACKTIINNCCNKHEPRNLGFHIQGWCENCSDISYFQQIVTNQKYYYLYKGSNFCRLCGSIIVEFQLCPNCYLISFEFTESNFTIPILHLSWWDAYDLCIICDRLLKSRSDCQKWCSKCYIIYTGCRYCLTTNIIFGIVNQSQCMKCKRMLLITTINVNNITNIGEHLLKLNTHNYNQIANYVNNIDKNSNPLEIYNYIKKLRYFDLKIYSQIIANLESNEDSMPIMFVPFNNNEDKCYCCNKVYSETPLFKQKYCKDCLYWCIKYATSSMTNGCVLDNLDVYVGTTNTNCKNHEPRNLNFCIQGWCENCCEILYFKQIVTNCKSDFCNIDHFYEENHCRLCGKLIYKRNKQDNVVGFKLCSNCHLLSFEFTESNFTIPILHLSWWDAYDQCIICNQYLELNSDCHKWCSNCVVSYTGCRYCLTTNIIFGIANQSQCIKCRRILLITINSKNNMANIGKYLLKFNTHNYNQIANYVNNVGKNFNPLEIYDYIKKLRYFDLKIYSQIIANLESNEDSMPIMFVPFNNNEDKCYCCNKVYSETPLFKQKYCKDCLYWCIKYATSSLTNGCVLDNLDVYVGTTNTNCKNHEPRNLNFCIQGWCENCCEILYFKQIVTNCKSDFCNIDHFYEENHCRLCGKLIYKRNIQDNIVEYKLCSNCYLFSFELIESTSTVPILYLSWWDTYNQCIVCDLRLEFKSNCQKWCSNCFIIYTGCRYCLTTNVIFGYIDQSQCKKCKRVITIDITGSCNIDEFLYLTRVNIINDYQSVDYFNINKISNPSDIYSLIKKFNYFSSKPKIEWISYSQIENLTKIAEGGYGKIYKASINGNIVAVKEILNSQVSSKCFLNEIKSLYQCYDDKFEYIIKCHGITKNPITREFMFIMKYANGGNLHDYLRENFTKITWKKKLYILWRISDG